MEIKTLKHDALLVEADEFKHFAPHVREMRTA